MIPSTYQNQDDTKADAPPYQTPLTNNVKSRRVVYFWLLLLIAIIGGGSASVFYFYVQTSCQLLKASWQMLMLAIALVPFAFVEHSKRKDDYIYSKENLSNKNSWATLLWSSLGYSVMAAGSAIALNHAGVGHITPLLNLSPIIIILYKLQQGVDTSSNEKLGIVLSVLGVIMLMYDSPVSSKEDMVNLQTVSFWDKIIFGDLVAILGSIGGAFFFIKTQELKDNFPMFLRALATTFFSFLQLTFAAIMLEDATISFDSLNGIFGVFSSEWFWLYLVITLTAGFGGYLANLYYMASFYSFSMGPILILQPIASTLIITILGWQSFPGLMTVLGELGVLFGIMAVTCGFPSTWTNKDQTPSETLQVPLIDMR